MFTPPTHFTTNGLQIVAPIGHGPSAIANLRLVASGEGKFQLARSML
jgi:hypothetical protein